MANHYSNISQTQITPRPTTTTTSSSLLPKLREHVSNSNQLFGIFTLLITGTVLIFLTGLTIVGTILSFILFLPLIILLIPIWVPVFSVIFLVTMVFLSMCGFGLVVVAVLTWVYRYFKGLQPPPGSNRVKDHGGYLQSKVMMNAATGA